VSPAAKSSPSRRTAARFQTVTYQHVQFSRILAALLVIPMLATMVVIATHAGHREELILFELILGISLYAFSSLKTQVTADQLMWQFGPGLIRKSIPMREIASAEITKTRWVDGWGIHYTRRGWLYNAAGYDAVLVRKKDGSTVLIGSNDVAGLWEAIQQGLSPESNPQQPRSQS
jgi:hypothetical protein